MIILAVALGVALAACQKSEQAATASQVDIKVPTIQCESCVNNVKVALQELQGVKTASVDLNTKIGRSGSIRPI